MTTKEQSLPQLLGLPSSTRRPWIRLFAVGFLFLQALIPLRYYLGDDPYDERFSWRMFSAVRVIACHTRVTEHLIDGRTRTPVLRSVIHEAWVEILRRNRKRAIRAFLARRCDEEGTVRVVLENRCIDAKDQRLPPRSWERICSTGRVMPPEPRP